MKIILWDLETFGFDFRADSGFLLCGSYKTLGETTVKTISRSNIREDMWNDKEVCQKLYDVLSTADGWITHNGKRFDIPFLNTRLIKHNLAPLPNTPHFDTCYVMWKKLKMRNSLANAQKFLNIGIEKTPLNLETWTKAASGNKDALTEVIKHCIMDVNVLEKVYNKIRTLGFPGFNLATMLNNPTTCPVCTKPTLIRQGSRCTDKRRYQRLQCQSCGKWVQGKEIK